jgi:hypothetical protein
MSTLNVNAIDKESGSTLTLGGSGTTVNVSNMVPDVALSNRNLIIGGAMNVAQRATQVTGVTTSGYRTCDRFSFDMSALGTWTVDQSTDSPNVFSNSFKLTCTTADASPAAGDYALLYYSIEAQNLQHLGFGTADAKSLTLSFWVKSNKTGSASAELIQDDNSNKLFSNSYTINSADTWEYKTISIPADTAGIINNDNGAGLNLGIWLNSGSSYTGGSHATTWAALNQTNRNVSNLAVGGAVNDYFAITGVQLEVGDVATPFEHESFGQTLAKCQRYYYRLTANANYSGWADGYWNNANQATLIFPISVPMRSSPSVDSTGLSGDYILVNANAVHACTSIPSFFKSTITSDGSCALVTLLAYSTGNGTAGNATQLVSLGGGAWTGDFLGLDAEL